MTLSPRHPVFVVTHSYSATINGWDEVEFPRTLGVYSTRRLAEAALERARGLPGFDMDPSGLDEFEGLSIEEWDLGEVGWRGGFFSVDEAGREE